MQLESEARLRGAVAALGTAWRFVREDAAAFEPVGGDIVRHGLERAGVEGGGDAVRAVRSAVECAPKMHRGDAAVGGDTRADPHQDRMAATMRVEDLLAAQRAFDRTAGEHRELADDDLVRERVGLAAEPAAMSGADHADSIHRQLEHLGQRAVHVMHDLGRRPERDLPVDIGSDRAVLLHG